jgi:anthranilate phosphoribosyltransferase
MIDFIKNVLENKLTLQEQIDFFIQNENQKLTPQELAEIVTYLKSLELIKINLNNSIDICWTWWSWLDRINTSTITCVKLSQMWINVAKHWNNASSWRFWSFDLIEKLWYKIPNSKEEILKEFNEKNIAFLYAKNFYPFLKVFSESRKEYKKPTIFNILWPLLNPSNSDYQIIWCSFLDKMGLMIETCKILWRKNVLLVRWEDWLDEITLSWKTKVYELRDWKIKDYYITPEDFWFKKVELQELLEKDIDKKIEIAKKIINDEKIGQYNNLINLNIKVTLDFLNK